MTARELHDALRALHPVPEPSVDRVVIGSPDTVVRGVGVMWMPTWAALRAATASGANVMVVHEPTFYTHWDRAGFDEEFKHLKPRARAALDATRAAKEGWIHKQGITIIRCHDVIDAMPGGVVDSLARELGFAPGDTVTTSGNYRVVQLREPCRAGEIVRRMARAFARLGQPGVGFYGDENRIVGKLGLGTGYGCDPWRQIELGAEMALVIDDRIKVWTEPVWAEDAGYPLAVINHGTSEEWGIRTLAEILRKQFPALSIHLVEQGCGYRWITGDGAVRE
jgi:putative NIF3 family GTP cyclohydrolase 1 type 2